MSTQDYISVLCRELPTANNTALDYTIGKAYQMRLVGFMLFSVRDDKGRDITFNDKQIQAFFINDNETRISAPDEVGDNSFLMKMARQWVGDPDIDYSKSDSEVIQQLKNKYNI